MSRQDAARRRHDLVLEHAAGFAGVAVKNIRAEFPSFIVHLMRQPGDFPQRPREIFPAFYGSFDWHSCVQMHWLLRALPGALPEAQIRAALDENLTERNLAAEAAAFRSGVRPVRPYGWGWALTLAAELEAWDDHDARRWSAHLKPLTEAIIGALLGWLPKSTYPSRRGEHSNTANGLRRSLDFARRSAAAGEPALLEAINDAAERWYASDAGYPGGWEPDAADFISPALAEAELLTELWPPERALPWLDAFLPGIAIGQPASLFTPASVSDDSDGQIAHLHGLNLTRAWCWRRLAELLPADDPRVPVMLDAAARHAEPELTRTTGSDYIVEHWLAAYAVLYLT
ncbi:MAG TPA: DUF2891 domain-containing protein [Streptosporangiaceae bacterium]|jgi:hypothetical protein